MNSPSASISRVTRSRKQAQALYDRLSPHYDWIAGAWENRLRRSGLDVLAVQEGERVLEIGPANGAAIPALANSARETGQVVAIDLSPRMLAFAAHRVAGSAQTAPISFVCGDAVQLPFHSGSFDTIFSSFTLELFDTPEIPVFLAECSRVLTSPGRMVLVSLSKAGRANWMCRLYEWSHSVFPGLVDCRPIFLAQAIESAGFSAARVYLQNLAGLPVEIVLATHRAD